MKSIATVVFLGYASQPSVVLTLQHRCKIDLEISSTNLIGASSFLCELLSKVGVGGQILAKFSFGIVPELQKSLNGPCF